VLRSLALVAGSARPKTYMGGRRGVGGSSWPGKGTGVLWWATTSAGRRGESSIVGGELSHYSSTQFIMGVLSGGDAGGGFSGRARRAGGAGG
jgi:hypothetical protein